MANTGRHTYTYSGPIIIFGKEDPEKFTATTIAVNEAAALSNLRYRYCKQRNKPTYAPVKMDKKYLTIED